MLREAAYRAAAAVGIDGFLRRRRAGGVILCYHNIIAEGDTPPGDRALHLPVHAFEDQLEFLARHFAVISLEELASRQRAGKSLRGTASITFDDGYRGVLQHAIPRLRARGLPAAMFVTSIGASRGGTFWWDWPKPGAEAGTAELRALLLDECRGDAARIATKLGVTPTEAGATFRPASWAELSDALGPDISIGVHTVSHRNLTALEDDELRREMAENAADIERELRVRPMAVAYPFGCWTPRVAAAAAGIGVRIGLTLDSNDVVSSTDPLSLPRVNIPASLSNNAFALWVSGLAALRAS